MRAGEEDFVLGGSGRFLHEGEWGARRKGAAVECLLMMPFLPTNVY